MSLKLHVSRTVMYGLAAVAMITSGCGGPQGAIEDKLRENVVFFSNFEKGVDALWSGGSGIADFDGEKTRHELNGGIEDGALRFQEGAAALSYKAERNFPYSTSGFDGAVAFWANVNSAAFDVDYPEPFHIGKRDGGFAWDDAVIFVDFKKPANELRFGCYPNKTGEVTDEMASAHTISLSGVNWKDGDWHHIVISWSNFNSGKQNAEWALYVDGKEVGRKKNLKMDLTWDMPNQVFRFNHYKFAGVVDELAVFKTSLEPADAAYLFKPRRPLNLLLKKKP